MHIWAVVTVDFTHQRTRRIVTMAGAATGTIAADATAVGCSITAIFVS
jgi:hypothetical protein